MRIPTSNLSLMIASVCLSGLLWFWVGAEERSEIVLSVPLEYRNLTKGHEIVSEGQLLTSVNVWVRGTTATIKNLRPDQVSAWVDLAKAKPGTKHFELDPEHVAVPYGFSVLRISPSRVNLRIEQVSRRSVPVVPRLDGQLAEGYEVTNVAVNPPHVEIIGPHSALNLITQVTTDSINIAGLSGNLSEEVNVGLEHSAVRLGAVKQVKVLLTILPIQDVLTLRHVPVTTSRTTLASKIVPRTVRVDLLAPKNILEEIIESNVRAILDMEGLKAGVYELTPRIVVENPQSDKISVKEVIPERVRVRVQ